VIEKMQRMVKRYFKIAAKKLKLRGFNYGRREKNQRIGT
jgi:hypothetical protein